MSLVFCVSTHVQRCEVRQYRVEIKKSGEDIVCLAEDFLCFVVAQQGKSQDMTLKKSHCFLPHHNPAYRTCNFHEK